MSSASLPRPCRVQAVPPSGAPCRRCGRRASGRRAAPASAGRSGTLAREPDVGDRPAGSRASCAATYAASAGSRRGSIAHTTASASISPVVVDTAATRPSRTTRSRAVGTGQHGDPAGREPGGRARRRAGPCRRGPSTRRSTARGRRSCPTTPARCAGRGPRRRRGGRRPGRSRSSRKSPRSRLCSISRLSNRAEILAAAGRAGRHGFSR